MDYVDNYVEYTHMKKLPLCINILARSTDLLKVNVLKKYRNRILSSEIQNLHTSISIYKSLTQINSYRHKNVSVDSVIMEKIQE